MLAHLDSEIQNDSNTAKIDLLLPGIIQHVSLTKEAQINVHFDLEKDIQKITSHKKEGVIMQKIETTVKQTVNSTLAKLGQYMATLKRDDCIKMVEHMVETVIRNESFDEQSNTTLSTADNDI